MHPAVKKWLVERGRKGGLVKSEKKTAAAQANIRKRWANHEKKNKP